MHQLIESQIQRGKDLGKGFSLRDTGTGTGGQSFLSRCPDQKDYSFICSFYERRSEKQEFVESIALKLIDQVKSAFMEKKHGDKENRSGKSGGN